VSNRIIVFFLLLYALLLIIACYAFQFDGLYGQDGYAYLRQAKDFFVPKLQGEFWPPMYALTGWLLSLVIHNEVFSLQLVSILSLTISAFLLIQIIQHLYKGSTLVFGFAVISYLLSPFAVRSGVIVMSDAIATIFCLLTSYFIFVSTRYYKIFFVLLFASLALLSRYATAVVLFPLIGFELVNGLKQKQWLAILSGSIIVLILIYLNFTYWANTQGSSQHAWLQNWELKNLFSRSFTTTDGSSTNTFPNIIYVFKNIFYPGFLILFIPLSFFIRREDFKQRTSLLLLSSILLYAFFLAGIPFQNERFLLLTFPFVLILFYPAFVRMLQWKPYMKYAPVLISIIAIPLSFRAIYPMYERNLLEKNIASQLSSYQGRTLYAFDMDVSLQGRGYNFNYRNLWEKKYEQFDKNALVLFNEEKFEKQWGNKNPMLNFNALKNNYSLIPEKKLPGGWMLFSIQ
jgi:hypothetical protein